MITHSRGYETFGPIKSKRIINNSWTSWVSPRQEITQSLIHHRSLHGLSCRHPSQTSKSNTEETSGGVPGSPLRRIPHSLSLTQIQLHLGNLDLPVRRKYEIYVCIVWYKDSKLNSVFRTFRTTQGLFEVNLVLKTVCAYVKEMVHLDVSYYEELVWVMFVRLRIKLHPPLFFLLNTRRK